MNDYLMTNTETYDERCYYDEDWDDYDHNSYDSRWSAHDLKN